MQAPLQLLCDSGDQGILDSAGELLQFCCLRCLLALTLQAKSKQTVIQVSNDLVVAAMARKTEAAADLNAQQVTGNAASRELLHLPLKAIKIPIAVEAKRDVVPADATRRDCLNLGSRATVDLHREHLAALVVLTLIKAIRLRSPRVPGLLRDLLEVVPIAKGDVVDLGLRKRREVNQVVGPSLCLFIKPVLTAAKAMDSAMG